MAMAQYQNINFLLHALAFCENRKRQHSLLKEIAALIPCAKRDELQELLRILTSTPDVDFQIKIFTILSAYLVSRAEHADVIISCNSLYDKVQIILSSGPPRRTATMLNFLTAIMYVDEDTPRKRSLSMYARNMIRVSGCLAMMCDTYTNCMMYQDTWKSLCMCLSVCCRGLEFNQSYCTHLIPMSIQRCIQGDKDVFLLLQSLLQNNERNTKLFLDSDGAAVFSGQLLQHDSCMQLLDTVVQNSPTAAMAVCDTDVVETLRSFLHQYAPHTQLGQWASIVLYHIDSQIKLLPQGVSEKSIVNKKICVNGSEAPLDNSKQTDSIDRHNVENTTTLLHNVIKEVYNCRSMDRLSHERPLKSREQVKHAQSNHKRYDTDAWPFVDKPLLINTPTRAQTSKNLITTTHCIPKQSGRVLAKTGNDLSFSFLGTDVFRPLEKTNQELNSRRGSRNFIESNRSIEPNYDTMHRAANFDKLIDIHQTLQVKDESSSEVELISFAPQFMSTPKSKTKEISSSRENQKPKIGSRSSFSFTQTRRDNKMNNIQKNKHYRVIKCSKETKQRSFSNRVLGAINESCTSIVKSVRNLFKSRPNNTTIQITNVRTADTPSLCTYSFTNYMRKRDAGEILAATSRNSLNAESDSSTQVNSDAVSCKTCNDTVSLKKKLNNNNHLKQTVKKLKLGINLYGCDFKKISKALWPHDAFMRPEVLYNLYRKLIVK